ncbi:MAG: glycosyltransferase [Cyanobacteria bacterium J06592_8]
MLFDLSLRGHHPIYIRHLIQYWQKFNLVGNLDIVVLPQFLEEHREVVDLAASLGLDSIKFVAITEEEATILNSRKPRIKRFMRNFQEWKIFCHYTQLLQATHGLLMYFDTCEFPLGFGVQSPCPFSGIYFRPTFHYGQELTNYQPSRQDKIQEWRERVLLSRILRNPQLQNLFCLDPFAVKHLNQYPGKFEAVHLPDPVERMRVSDEQSLQLREALGIESDRKVFLLFGAITARKGIYQILEAIALLSPEECQKLCLILVGESSISDSINAEMEKLRQTHPVQFICRYEFISDGEVETYFKMVDVVLAPYQRHVGMSGILLLAAAAEKPVLSSDYGLMGEMVKRYGLGLTADSTVPSQISQGLSQLLSENLDQLYDRTRMQSFAQQNSAEAFAEIIFKKIGVEQLDKMHNEG